MSDIPRPRRRVDVLTLSLVLVAVLIIAAWTSIALEPSSVDGGGLTAKTWHELGRFVGELLGLLPGWQARTPAFLDGGRWWAMGRLAYQTLAMSVLAIGIAALGALITALPAARAASGAMPPARVQPWRTVSPLRAVYIVSRSIPELLFALLIIFVFSPGILPGAIALGLHNFGILGKLFAETVENLDPHPARALQASGAGRAQVLLYAVLPRALPQLLTYTLYRWEVIIRTTIVVGFVGAAGLGQEFRLDISFFRYTDITLILITYLLLAGGVDLASAGLRRLARAA